MTLATQYNNPGNVSLPIQGWSGGGTIVGAPGQPGYASFPDMATGTAAFQQRVSTYINRGYTTISSLNSIYARDQNWKYGVSRASGIGLNDPIDPNDQDQMNALMGGIVRQETGQSASSLGINFGSNSQSYTQTTDNSANATPDNGAPTGILDPSAPASDPRWAAADSNGDGTVTMYELKQYNLAQQAAKLSTGGSAGQEGKPSDVPTAIVTGANQQSQATLSAAQVQAQADTANTAATNATNTGIWQGLQTWLGGRLLQIMVFVIAAIFLLVGLYMFTPKGTTSAIVGAAA